MALTILSLGPYQPRDSWQPGSRLRFPTWVPTVQGLSPQGLST